MLCDDCKEKEAKVHLTKIINNEKNEIHLCDECARKREEFYDFTPFSIHDLLASFMDIGKTPVQPQKPEVLKCSTCGMDYKAFKKSGRLGCSECYKFFNNELQTVIKRFQSGLNHNGKIPHRAGLEIRRKQEIIKLKESLKKAVEAEAFEEAAELRDKIKEMEKQINKD